MLTSIIRRFWFSPRRYLMASTPILCVNPYPSSRLKSSKSTSCASTSCSSESSSAISTCAPLAAWAQTIRRYELSGPQCPTRAIFTFLLMFDDRQPVCHTSGHRLLPLTRLIGLRLPHLVRPPED